MSARSVSKRARFASLQRKLRHHHRSLRLSVEMQLQRLVPLRGGIVRFNPDPVAFDVVVGPSMAELVASKDMP